MNCRCRLENSANDPKNKWENFDIVFEVSIKFNENQRYGSKVIALQTDKLFE